MLNAGVLMENRLSIAEFDQPKSRVMKSAGGSVRAVRRAGYSPFG